MTGEHPVDCVARHPRVLELGRDADERERARAFAVDLARWMVGRPAEELGPLARVVTLVAHRQLRDTRWLCRDRPLLAVEAAARAAEVLWPYLTGEGELRPGDGEGEPTGEGSGEAEDQRPGNGDDDQSGGGGPPGDGQPGAGQGGGPGQPVPGMDAEAVMRMLRQMAGGAPLECSPDDLAGAEGTTALSEAADAATRGAIASDKLARTIEQLVPGVGWSTAPGQLERQLLDPLETLAKLLEKLPELRKLADQLGRVEEASRRKGRGTGGREEVVGVHLGGDATTALPSELALLGDADTEDLFYERYLERRLVSLELTGRGDDGVADGEERGPVIACIDTSSSMSGAPELAAKALVLAICRKVVPQGRIVHLILFGGYGEKTEVRLSRGSGLEGLLAFLKSSFQAGTDFDGPLVRAVDLLREASLKAADILVVTDGYGRADPWVVDRVNQAKRERLVTSTAPRGQKGPPPPPVSGLRVWSVVLGRASTAGVEPFSDRIFQLDPGSSAETAALVQLMHRR